MTEMERDEQICQASEKYVELHLEHKEEDGVKIDSRDFPGGTVVMNPPANAEDTGASPGPGRSHMLRSN